MPTRGCEALSDDESEHDPPFGPNMRRCVRRRLYIALYWCGAISSTMWTRARRIAAKSADCPISATPSGRPFGAVNSHRRMVVRQIDEHAAADAQCIWCWSLLGIGRRPQRLAGGPERRSHWKLGWWWHDRAWWLCVCLSRTHGVLQAQYFEQCIKRFGLNIQ